jgi:hypothetical protein
MSYLQTMNFSIRRLALVVAVLALTACGGSSDGSTAGKANDADTATVIDETNDTESEDQDEDDDKGDSGLNNNDDDGSGDHDDADDDGVGNAGSEPVALGGREAGYGPGSLAVLAGQYAERLTDLEGDWFRGPPVPLTVPDVCGFPEPSAVQGFTLAQPVDASGLRADVVSVEVRVHETPDEAEALVNLINGETADDCDRASLEVALEAAVPGVSYDFGDGLGTPAPVPDGLPVGLPADSRSYDFDIIFGTVPEPLLQLATVVADGPITVSFSAASTPDNVEDLETQVIDVLFSEPAPEPIELPGLDALIDDVRRSVLSNEDVPAFYDPTHAMVLSGPSYPSECITAAQPAVTAFGPFWISVSPGTGASELGQVFRIFADADSASAAFEEFTTVGVDCFVAELGLPVEFELTNSTTELTEVDGQQVVHVELDYLQKVGEQAFDVEAKFAVTQTGPTLTSAQFFGLAGDSPNLPKLVATSAIRGADDGS